MSQAVPPSRRQKAMSQLIRGVSDDLADYGRLQALLEQQFDAALRHQSVRLGELAAAITPLCETLELRRQQRVALAVLLLGPEPEMRRLFVLLEGRARARLEANWASLEAMVCESKRLGKRTSDLLLGQFSIMQRVLHGEEHTYAPA